MAWTAKIVTICGVGLLLLLLTTDPAHLPSVMLFVPFLLLFMALWLGGSALLNMLGMRRSMATRLGLFLAALPTLMLVLQSIGQLTFRDVVTISALFGIAYFYMSRFSRSAD